MHDPCKAWMNRFLRLDRFITIGVLATQEHRFVAHVSFCDRDSNTLKAFSTGVSESPELALEALWNAVEKI